MKMTSFSNVHFSFIGETKAAYVTYLVQPMINYIAIAFVSGVLIAVAGNFSGIVMFIIVILIVLASLQAFAYLKKISTNFLVNNTQYGQGKFEVTIDTNGFMVILSSVAGGMRFDRISKSLLFACVNRSSSLSFSSGSDSSKV